MQPSPAPRLEVARAARRGGVAVIGVGIVGCNYGRTVLLPAFRTDPRCEVVALAGSDARAHGRTGAGGECRARVRRLAGAGRGSRRRRRRHRGAARSAARGRAPRARPRKAGLRREAARRRSRRRAGHARRRRARSGQPTIIDFNFPELPSWRRAKAMLDSGALGRLRHVVVTWNVENQATRLRLKSWKTRGGDGGGGLLGNFVCHCFYYLEWFCGPIAGLGGRVFSLPDGDAESSIALALAFASGAGGSLQMSCASFLGSGHRLEFYGDDGTLVLANPTADYFRGFELMQARRSRQQRCRPVATEDVSADRIRRFPRRAGGAAGAPLHRCLRAGRHSVARLRRRLSRAGPDRCGAARARLRPLDRRRAVGRGAASVSARRILVTGGSGFIGSALVKALVRAGRGGARVRRQFPRRARAGSPEVERDIEFVSGDIRDAGRGRCRHARHRRGASSRLRQRHGDLLQRARTGARCRRQGHRQRHRRLPAPRRRAPGPGLELGGLSVAAAGADRRERAARGSRSAQSAPLLRRRQDHQRDDGDQLRPQAFRARADLSAAQCLWSGHGLRSRHSAIRACG